MILKILTSFIKLNHASSDNLDFSDPISNHDLNQEVEDRLMINNCPSYGDQSYSIEEDFFDGEMLELKKISLM